jgi:hypothetical protein
MMPRPTDNQPTDDEQPDAADATPGVEVADDTAVEITDDTTDPPPASEDGPGEQDSGQQGQDDTGDEAESDSSAETFSRTYVERLRRESATYRERARTAEHYAARLHTELVRATGRLADPTDLPFNAKHLDDPDALAAAVDDLLARKPHLASRRPTGEIGQGAMSGGGPGVDLAAILRSRASH